jgi:hypothetical protein
VPKGLDAYVATNLVLAIGATFALLLFRHALSLPKQAAVAGLVLLTLAGWGALFERRRWAIALETARLALAAAVAVAWLRGSVPMPALAVAAAAAATAMSLWAWRYRAELGRPHP